MQMKKNKWLPTYIEKLKAERVAIGPASTWYFGSSQTCAACSENVHNGKTKMLGSKRKQEKWWQEANSTDNWLWAEPPDNTPWKRPVWLHALLDTTHRWSFLSDCPNQKWPISCSCIAANLFGIVNDANEKEQMTAYIYREDEGRNDGNNVASMLIYYLWSEGLLGWTGNGWLSWIIILATIKTIMLHGLQHSSETVDISTKLSFSSWLPDIQKFHWSAFQ